MNSKQTRFQEGPPTSQPSRTRRPSLAQPRAPPTGSPWDNSAPAPHIEVNESIHRQSSSRTPRRYHSHSRNSSGDTFYTTRPSPIGQSGAPSGSSDGILRYSNDGIRVYSNPESSQSQLPARETHTPAHIPRHVPPPMIDPFVPRTAPIRIPNTAPIPPPIRTSFHHVTPPVLTPPHYNYGASPPRQPLQSEIPIHSFENLRVSSEARSSRDTFNSHSTDHSGDRPPGSRGRRGSMREEGFQFPIGSADRDPDTHRGEGRPRHQRRRSSNGQAFLGPSPMSASHSRNPSEESVFPPAEDFPKRRNSIRERDHKAVYPLQPPYNPPARQGGVTIHQAAYDIATATGNLGHSGGRGEMHFEAPLPEVWIAVMGVTGSGKSTFIQTATGDRSVGVNHGLRSCTREVEVHTVRIGGYQVNLIDTPGFDDNKRSEAEVLQTISAYLAKACYNKIFLNGIIYIHSIMQPRMGGSGIRSLGILERIVGNDNMDNVLLVSNMWDALKNTINTDGNRLSGQEVGELRERELCTSIDFWKNLINMGAGTSRHRGDSWRSAHELIRRFLPDGNNSVGRPMKLLLQKELVDQMKRLEETEVGKYINEKLYEGQQNLEKEISELRRKHQRIVSGHAAGSTPGQLETLLEEKKKGLNETRKDAEVLGRRVDQLIDDQGNKVTSPMGRTSGSHAGLCNVM